MCSVTVFARVEICLLLVRPYDYPEYLFRRDAPAFDALPKFYARQAGSKISSREFSSAFRRARTPSGSVNMGRGV
jgi:hypothetical protein